MNCSDYAYGKIQTGIQEKVEMGRRKGKRGARPQVELMLGVVKGVSETEGRARAVATCCN